MTLKILHNICESEIILEPRLCNYHKTVIMKVDIHWCSWTWQRRVPVTRRWQPTAVLSYTSMTISVMSACVRWQLSKLTGDLSMKGWIYTSAFTGSECPFKKSSYKQQFRGLYACTALENHHQGRRDQGQGRLTRKTECKRRQGRSMLVTFTYSILSFLTSRHYCELVNTKE